MIRLEKINSQNVWEILKLKVRDGQRNFVAPNDESIIDGFVTITNGGCVYAFGIYADRVPVGFLMIGYGDANKNLSHTPGTCYTLWRLMIDEHCQRRGYGRQALALALDFIRDFPCGYADFCLLSYEPENTAARNLYHSFGFHETGDTDSGEIVAALRL